MYTVKELREGRLELGLAAAGDLRWAVVELANVLEEARIRLDLSPVAAVALGRSLSAAALLLRFTAKVPSRLWLEVEGDGPLGRIIADVDSEGRMRGRVGAPQLPTPEDGDLAIGWAVGQGLLRVSQEIRGKRYTSQVALRSGEIGKDLTHFLEQSEQIHSAVLLGVLPRPTGIAAAGGLIVEALPGVREDTLSQLEANIGALGGVSAYLDQGGLEALADAVLSGFDREAKESHPLIYACRCSRDSLLAQLGGLGAAEIDAVIAEDGYCHAICDFCGDRHRFSREELLAAAGKPLTH